MNNYSKKRTLVVTGVNPDWALCRVSAFFCTCGHNNIYARCVRESDETCQPCSGPYGLFREDDDSIVFMDFYNERDVEASLHKELPRNLQVKRLTKTLKVRFVQE